MDEFWVAFIAALIYIPLLLLWVFAMVDIFGRRDLSGWGKALWLFAVIILPLFGTLIYLITRPVTPTEMERLEATARAQDAAYARSTADELDKLTKLRDHGDISAEEYAQLKMRVVGAG